MRNAFVALLASFALLAPAGPAGAAGSKLMDYPVPRGGFSLMLPTTWVDLTNTTPSPDANGKLPSLASIAKAAASDGPKKLVVADPTTKGAQYINVDVERIGDVSAAEAADANLKALKGAVSLKSKVSMTKVTLAAGPAYLIHFVYSLNKKTLETNEYVLVHNQVEYLVIYVAPHSSWAGIQATYEKSAASFRFLAPPTLTGIVLKTSQVGAGYKASLLPGGDSFIDQTTLDLCGQTYPSEALRTGRLQMRYLHSGRAVTVSNEVVTYTPGGAAEALREVRAVAKSCAQKPVVVTRSGVTSTFSVSPVKDSKLLPGSVAVRVTVTAKKGKKTATSVGIAIYQVKKDTLSGVYAWSSAGTSQKQAFALGLRAAEASAHNLGGGNPLTA